MTLEYRRLGCRCVSVMSVLMICSIHTNAQCPMPQGHKPADGPLETSEVHVQKQGRSLTRCIARAAVAAVRLLMPPGRRSQSVKKSRKQKAESRNYTADAIVLIPTTRSQREEIPEMLLLINCWRPDSIDVFAMAGLGIGKWKNGRESLD